MPRNQIFGNERVCNYWHLGKETSKQELATLMGNWFIWTSTILTEIYKIVAGPGDKKAA